MVWKGVASKTTTSVRECEFIETCCRVEKLVYLGLLCPPPKKILLRHDITRASSHGGE